MGRRLAALEVPEQNTQTGSSEENMGFLPAVQELVGPRQCQLTTAEMQVVQAAIPRMGGYSSFT